MKQSRHAISMLIEKYRAVIQKTWWKILGADDSGLHRCRKGICAAALLVSLTVCPGLAAAETINYDGTDPSLLKPEPIAGIANSLFPSSVTGNTVTVTGGSVPGYVYGGVVNIANTSVANNTVNISGGTVNGHVYGGLSWQGSADSNSVNITGGIVHSYVYGGYSNNSVANGNTVTISNGTVNGGVEGGHSYNDATNNSVTISGNAAVGPYVYGGSSASGIAGNNSVTINGGTVGSVYGGYSANGNVASNTITISGGQVNGSVYGGSASGTASGNTVNINSGTVNGDVFGGGGHTVTGNTVTISGGTFGSNRAIYAGGGTTVTGNTLTISGNPDLANTFLYGTNQMAFADWSTAGNILNVKSSGMKAKEVANFQYYNFYLPTSMAANETMLSVTNAANLTGTTIGVGINGTTTALHQGDRVTLLHTDGGLTAPSINNTTAVVPASIARTDVFTLTTDANNLYATATSLQAGGGPNPPGSGPNPLGGGGLNPQSKALLEGRMASIAHISQGADLLTTQGIESARSAVINNNESAGFFAMSGNHNQYQTGSHVDLNGFSLVAGVGKKNKAANSTMLNGLFLETGRGNYSTYNSFINMASARGDGDTRYFGGGYLVRSQQESGQYLEGSVRAGRASTTFNSGDLSAAIGQNVAYDISSPYYGLHLAFGKEKEVGQNLTLDTYVKGIWTHQNDSSATVTGDPINFDAVNSNRWQLGARLTHKANAQTTVRTGLTYQYEFDGKARGTAYGMSIDSPSLKGGSASVEVGVTIAKKDNKNFFLDISLQGFVGKCKGIAGNVESTWKF